MQILTKRHQIINSIQLWAHSGSFEPTESSFGVSLITMGRDNLPAVNDCGTNTGSSSAITGTVSKRTLRVGFVVGRWEATVDGVGSENVERSTSFNTFSTCREGRKLVSPSNDRLDLSDKGLPLVRFASWASLVSRLSHRSLFVLFNSLISPCFQAPAIRCKIGKKKILDVFRYAYV